MIKKLSLAALGLAALTAAGCSTVSSGEYAVVREELRTDPALRRQAIASCARDFSRSSAADRANLAGIAGVSVARAPGVVCTRIFQAIASGQISYQDFKASGGDYSKWIAVMRG